MPDALPFQTASTEPAPHQPYAAARKFVAVTVTWLVLAGVLILLAWRNLSVPGLYYDEAHCAGMAKDFLTGHIYGQHMPGCEVISLFGRPFPAFVQPYGGAIKSWLLLPAFYLFGSSLPVLRLTALCWGLVALLLFMLWTWRWLGTAPALVAGALLALDPTWFFSMIFDSGPVIPSFLCRFACLYFALRWWQHSPSVRPCSTASNGHIPQSASRDALKRILGGFLGPFCDYHYAFLAGISAGLGFFNKVDFVVFLGGTSLAVLCCCGRSLWARLRRRPLAILVAGLGFLLAAGPMLGHFPQILRSIPKARPPGTPGELAQKLNTMRAMCDGTYYYRFIDSGGMDYSEVPEKWRARIPVFGPLGVAFCLAAVYLAIRAAGRNGVPSAHILSVAQPRRVTAFLLLASLFVTLGFLFLPGAVNIHHAIIVFPFPHLVVATALTLLWRTHRQSRGGAPSVVASSQEKIGEFTLGSPLDGNRPAAQRRARAGFPAVLAAVLFFLLLAGQLLVTHKTQQLIRETGGRGWWSESLGTFAQKVKNRADLTILSLDWGFNEQLMFLTDGPKLAEPFWGFEPGQAAPMPAGTNYVYLVHPAEYSLFDFGPQYLEAARRAGPNVDIQPYYDRQKRVAFYAICFASP